MKEGDPEYLAKYYAELPEQMAREAVLLEELRTLGVISILEKRTKKKIVPIRPIHFEYLPATDRYIPLEWVTEDELDQVDSHLGKWGVVFDHEMRGSGRCSNSLLINMTSDIWGFCPALRKVGEDSVQMAYTRDKKLIIAGERVTFSDNLPENSQEINSLVKSAIFEAFDYPKQTRYLRQFVSLNDRSSHFRFTASV